MTTFARHRLVGLGMLAALLSLAACVGEFEIPVPEHQDDILTETPPPRDVRQTASTGPRVLFVNFDGQSLTPTTGWSDAAANTTPIGKGGTIPPFQGNRQTVLTQVRAFFAPFNVEVVATRPSSGAYEMVMVGGKGGDIGEKPYWGLAALDCNDMHPNSVGFTYGGEILESFVQAGYGSDSPKYLYTVASVVAHEAGHMFGLLHTLGTCDLMSYERHELCPYQFSFLDQVTPLRATDKAKSCLGQPTQNSYQQLLATLGAKGSQQSGLPPSPPAPPTPAPPPTPPTTPPSAPPPTPAPVSCVDKCDSIGDQGGCYCDADCQQYGDCCADYASACL